MPISLGVYKKPATMEEIEENIYLPVTRAHLAVLRSIFNVWFLILSLSSSSWIFIAMILL